MEFVGALVGLVVLLGLAVVLFKPRSEAPPIPAKKPTERAAPGSRSADADRILAKMKAMAAPTLLLTLAKEERFSKLGGDPELPNGAEWPLGPEGPLGFLLQVDLAAAKRAGGPEWLPSEGALYVFHDGRYGMRDQVRTIFSTSPAGPPLAPPANLNRGWRYPERRTDFSLHTSAPSLDWLGEDVRKIDVTDGELDELSDLPGLELGDGPHHRIGGYPIEIQEEQLPVLAELEARGLKYLPGTPVSAEIEQAAEVWRMLVQIDSDSKLKMNWGDGGQFYVLIRELDAKAGDFSQIVTLSQTY